MQVIRAEFEFSSLPSGAVDVFEFDGTESIGKLFEFHVGIIRTVSGT